MRLQTKRVASDLTSILILTSIAWAGQLHNASLSEAKTPGRNSSVKSDSNSVALIQLAPEDTRKTHEDKLIQGENYSPVSGKMANVSCLVYFNNPGRYYVWVRAYSTGTEDKCISG